MRCFPPLAIDILADTLSNLLTDLSTSSLPSPLAQASLQRAIKPVLSSKQYGNEEALSKLVAEAALIVMPPKSVIVQ